MLSDEYGLPLEARSPWLAAVTTLSAFLICGLAPLIPFLLGMQSPLRPSIILTGAVFFAIGSVKSLWSTASWWRSGFATLFVGGTAAGLAYLVGVFLKNVAQ